MRGKKGGVACGDQVEIQLTGTGGQGVIENVLPRSALLFRSDAYREKLIAANVTQVIVVVAAVPSFSEELINRCLAAAESQHLQVLILLNKTDLAHETHAARVSLSLYRELGYQLVELSARTDIAPLLPHLKGHLSVLVGQSGMGKSTLVNALIPEARCATAGISIALDTGRHTTTHARLYELDEQSGIIDSPGLQEFGLHQLNREELAWGFKEFRPYIEQCRFSDCRHMHEPGCALIQALEEGKINRRRFDFYQKLLAAYDAMPPA
jgi:ribosome biogenesis GTPase / thiamine phosphate phosphatase